MMLRFLHWLSSKLERRAIHGEDGTLYLERFKIFGWMPGSARRYPFSVYLHRFHRPDLDDAPHSHPWKWAFSFVLSGSYVEWRRVGHRGEQRRVRWLNLLLGDVFHCIKRLDGEVWTLFIVGPKTSSWGFLVDEGPFGERVVPWRERLAQRGIKADY